MDTLRIVVLVLLIVVIALAATLGVQRWLPRPQEGVELPLNLMDVIPADWEPQDKRLPTVSIDGDDEEEWLLIYRYDSAQEGRGPIGGVIYDAQVDISPHQLGVRIPYRSAFLVPYKLLPDTYPGKGQGYLADLRVGAPEQADTDGDGKPDELIIKGYGHDPQTITRLSIFRWVDKERGYAVEHFHGDGGITPVDRNKDGVFEEIVVKERLHDRSQLCRRRVYRRQGSDHYKVDSPTLVFCYGRPEHPFYPEGVVLAFLLSSQGERDEEVRRPEVEPGLMTSQGRRTAGALGLHQVGSFRVLQLTYPGVAFSSGKEAVEEHRELRGMEQIEVWTEVMVGNDRRSYAWWVVNTSSQEVGKDTIWRIDGVYRR